MHSTNGRLRSRKSTRNSGITTRSDHHRRSRAGLAVLVTLACCATVIAIVLALSSRGVLVETKTTIGGQVFALWLEEKENEVWCCVQQNPGWLSHGAFSTSTFVAADAATAREYGPDFQVPVIPRERWHLARIHVDPKSGTARFVLDTAEIEFEFQDMEFSDPTEGR